jgi:hypothetical protein
MNWFRKAPPVGTPENPEIIEPGQNRPFNTPPSPRPPYFLIFRWLLSALLPAILLDAVCLWLIEAAGAGNPLAWMLLIFLGIPAFFANLAVLAVLFFSFLFLTGRRVEIRGFMRR